MDPLSLTASIIAVLTLCQQSISYIATAKGARSDRSRLKQEISSCQGFLEDIKEEVEESDGDNDWSNIMKTLEKPGGPLNILESTLVLLVRKLEPKTDIKKVLAWPFEEKEIIKLLEIIERQKSLLSLALENNNRKLTETIAAQVMKNVTQLNEVIKLLNVLSLSDASGQQLRREEQKWKILNWISAQDYRHQEILEQRGKGTGTWILNNDVFKDWVESKIKTLWCQGIPGAGKSVMAAIITEYLRTEYAQVGVKHVTAALYCDYQKQSEQTLNNLIRSILRQVGESLDEIPISVEQLHIRAAGGQKSSPPIGNMELSAAFSSATSPLSLYVVIDALDEATEDVQNRITREISQLSFADIRILCTSRPLPKFKLLFDDCPQVEIRASEEDIRTFSKHQMSEGSRLYSLFINDSQLQEQILSTIVEKADGMFLMAKFHVDSLGAVASKSEVREALQKLPLEIGESYKKTMERIRKQHPRDQMRAEMALSWVFGAKRQLSAAELRHGLAITNLMPEKDSIHEDDLPLIDIVLFNCQGLLVQERRDDVAYGRWNSAVETFIRPVHYTATEYFTGRYTDLLPNGHANIAGACTQYLSLRGLCAALTRCASSLDSDNYDEEMSYAWGAVSNGSNTSKYEGEIKEYHLFPYAANFWSFHLQEARSLGFAASVSSIPWSLQFDAWYIDPQYSYNVKLNHGICRTIFLVRDEILKTLTTWREDGFDMNTSDKNGQTMLQSSVRSGHETATKFLLQLPDIHLEQPSTEEEDPLLLAIEKASTDTVRSILDLISVREEGSSLGHKRHGSYSRERLRKLQMRAATIPSWKGDRKAIMLLLLEKTRSFDPTDGRNLVLFIVKEAWYYHGDLLLFLLARDLNVRACDEHGNSALHIAIRVDERKCVDELIRLGADVGLANAAGLTPLQMAIDLLNLALVLKLLRSSTPEQRANVSPPNDETNMPDKRDAKESRAIIIISLLLQPQYVLARDANGRSALSWAVEDDSSYASEIVACLIELGSDVGSYDYAGQSVISHAVTGQSWFCDDISKLLLQAGANPNDIVPGGDSILNYCGKGTSMVIRNTFCHLLDAGAKTSQTDSSGKSILEHLVIDGNSEDVYWSRMIQGLLEHGEDINEKSRSGDTMLACLIRKISETANYDAYELLWTVLAAGTTPDVISSNEKTARDEILDIGDPVMVDILVAYDALQLKDINTQDAGKTALTGLLNGKGSQGLKRKIAKALLDAGAESDIRSSRGVLSVERLLDPWASSFWTY